MPTPCIALFDYACGFVTTDDIAAFAPDDLGYQNYVVAFRQILITGKLPRRATFEVSETIGLTSSTDANRETDPERFRRFRTFANAVGVCLSVSGIECRPANYLAIGLIDDAHALNDERLWGLLLPVFDELYQFEHARNSEESPFVLLAVLLLRARAGASDQEIGALAERVMSEEAKYFGHASNEFLWGCTFFDQMHDRWKWFVERLLTPTTQSSKLLREALLQS